MNLTSYQTALPCHCFARLKGLQPFRDSPSKSILHLRLSDGNTHAASINDFLLSESKTGNFFLLPKPDYTLHSQLTLTQHRSLLHYYTTETKLTAITLAERVRYIFYRDILKTLGFHREIRTPIPCFRDKCPQPVRRCGIKLNEQRESRSPRLCTWFYYLLTADNK